MRRAALSVVALLVVTLAGCNGSAPPVDQSTDTGDLTQALYIDAEDSWTTGQQQDDWFATKDALVNAYENICGDTFCDGDYGHIQSQGFHCSVRKTTGVIKQCVWVFGGSYESVTPSTGTVHAHSKNWACPIPATGTAAAFAAFVNAPGNPDALHRPLPGATGTIYDALATCL